MSNQQDLKAIRLFAGFSDDEIDAFVDVSVLRSVPADHLFFRMGNLNSSLFIICAGSVKIDRPSTADDISIATLDAGQTFGEMSFMDGSRTTAAATTAEPTEVLEISRESVDQLLEDNPALGVKLWRNFALDLRQRLAKTNELVDHYVDISQVLLDNPSLGQYYCRL